MKKLMLLSLLTLFSNYAQAYSPGNNDYSGTKGKLMVGDTLVVTGNRPTDAKAFTKPDSASATYLLLMTATGQVLMQQELPSGNAALEIKHPPLPAGLYLVKVKNNPKALTQKFTIR